MRTIYQTLKSVSRKRWLVPLAALLAGGIATSSRDAQAQTKDISIVGAKAYLGEGKYIDNATIVLRKGEIYKIKEGADPYKDSQVIHAEGRMVTAGLIAAETPLGLMEIEAESSTVDHARTDTHSIRAGFVPARAFFADSSTFGMALRGGVTSAGITPARGMVSGQIGFVDLLAGQHEKVVVNSSVAMRAALGQRHTGSRAATLSAFEQLLDDAILYKGQKRAHQRGDLRHLSAPAADLEAMLHVVSGKQRLLLHAERASDILAALDLAKRYKLDLALVGAHEGWKVAEQLAKAKAWVVLRPTDNLPGAFSRLGARPDNAALLYKAGVRVVFANLGSAHNVARLRQEAGNAVAHGFPHAAALDAITLGPAQLYEMDDDYGSLETGKVANLVIWSADPLELSSHAQEVIIRGEPQRAPTRQTLLRDRYLDLGKFAPTQTQRFPVTNPVTKRR